MGTKRKSSLEDAGKMVYSLNLPKADNTNLEYNWNLWDKDTKRKYIKLAIEIWRSVESCI